MQHLSWWIPLWNHRRGHLRLLQWHSWSYHQSPHAKVFFHFHSPILVRFQDSGRSRGYAHILLDDPKYVEQALAKNGQYIGDRYVRVQQANGQKSSIFFEIELIVVDVPTTNKNVTLPANCNSVFLKNLPYECTEEEIQEVFKYFPVFLLFILF